MEKYLFGTNIERWHQFLHGFGYKGKQRSTEELVKASRKLGEKYNDNEIYSPEIRRGSYLRIN
jgi:hypothetical protein